VSRYDLGRAKNASLFAVVRVTAPRVFGAASPVVDHHERIDPHTRQCLEAFASVLIGDAGEGFPELETLRRECFVDVGQDLDDLRERVAVALEALEATRWNPDGNLAAWASTPDGLNCERVNVAIVALRGEGES
jgi:hypothetical protein